MPTEVQVRRRPSWIEKNLDAFLVPARRCLILVAIALVTLMLVQLQISSWRVSEMDIPVELHATIMSL